MRIPLPELFIMRLKGTIPNDRLPAYEYARSKTVAECLEGLKRISGLDLGSNPAVWEKWWEDEMHRQNIGPHDFR